MDIYLYLHIYHIAFTFYFLVLFFVFFAFNLFNYCISFKIFGVALYILVHDFCFSY